MDDTGIEELYRKCELCPRMCGVDRTGGFRGYCGSGVNAEIALCMLHKWEEPCISGSDPSRGSGAIFFRHCSLGCVYCQNHEISRPGAISYARQVPEYPDTAQLENAMLKLEADGAYNVNLVTPTHYMPSIVTAAKNARKRGLNVPLVYNTGGFERAEMIGRLEGTVQISLTDFKYLTDATALKYSGTDKYVQNAERALEKMFEITGRGLEFDSDGMLKRGVIVRHLVLPGRSYAASKIIKKIYSKFGDGIIYSLMNQYTPIPDADPRLSAFPELMRPVGRGEYRKAVKTLEELAPEYAYIQEGGTISESFIPKWQD